MMGKERDVIKPQTPDIKKIRCKDCIYRDKTIIKIGGKSLPVGITRAYCSAFPAPVGKPKSVIFDNLDCPMYKKNVKL